MFLINKILQVLQDKRHLLKTIFREIPIHDSSK